MSQLAQNPPSPPRSAGRRAPVEMLRRVVAAVVVACLVGTSVVVPSSAGADQVTDLEVRADRIARDLLELQDRLGVIGEQFNQSQVRRVELAARKADLERRSELARREMAQRRADAARYAMSAYVGLDQGDVLSMALDGRQWDLSRRTGYAAIRIGDREQLVDDLRAAQKVNDDLVAALAEANRAETRIAADLERQQAEATRLMAEQEQLQNSVHGELAEAVAQRQAAIAAAERAAREPAPGTTAASGTGGAATWPGAAPPAPSPAGPGASGAGAAASATTATAGAGTAAPPTTRPGAPATNPPATAPPVTAPPVAPPPVAPPASGGRGQTVANAAVSQLGVRYSWGGGTASGPSEGFGPGAGIVGFDCSGLTLYAWAKVGVSLPHSAQIQYDMSAKVSLSALQPGDLVFYGTSSRDISHVGVYVGGGQIVHAPNSRSVVQYGPVNLWGGYYAWIGAGRPG